MNEPGCPEPGFVFVPGWRATIQSLCAGMVLPERGAECKSTR